MTQKQCFKCGEVKEIDDFYKHPEMSDGHVGKCKECNKADVSKNYAAKREQYAEYERKRYQEPKRHAMSLEYARRRRIVHAVKYHANSKTGNAIRDGKLVRQPCEVCGCEKVQAHHEDYTKPLNVEWLCRKHHLAKHGKVAYEPF